MKILRIEISNELRFFSVDRLADMAITAARRADKEIMRYYRQKVDVNYKQDDSPLTLADQKAHQVIVSY